MNDTGDEKSCLNRESNPGSLAYRAITLTTELKYSYTLSIISASFTDPVFLECSVLCVILSII